MEMIHTRQRTLTHTHTHTQLDTTHCQDSQCAVINIYHLTLTYSHTSCDCLSKGRSVVEAHSQRGVRAYGEYRCMCIGDIVRHELVPPI